MLTLLCQLALGSPLGPPPGSSDQPVQVALGLSGGHLVGESRVLRIPRRLLRGDWTPVDGVGVWLDATWVHGQSDAAGRLRGWSLGAGLRGGLRPNKGIGAMASLGIRGGREWTVTDASVDTWTDHTRLRGAVAAVFGPPEVRGWIGPSAALRLDRDLLSTDGTLPSFAGPHLLMGGLLTSSDLIGQGLQREMRVWTALELELIGIVSASLLVGVSF